MNEQRRQILQMLADGRITADEAERLIDAVQREGTEPVAGGTARPKVRPRYLRVVVNANDLVEGPSRINVRVPLQLLRAGVRLASLVPPQALHQVNAELHRSGVPIDLTQLKPQQLEELIEHLDEISVDIDSVDGKVQVFCE
ncbi:SHOCT-like domain-containing protein [Catellatospora bangladeshensis]|uniref:YvlB/LiaX N-terminal domain-containing protein n=1 Tax=Catellatospora bangladeshensis TaxID=310355 RepID=A0A8J3JM29_9ACTN|nr:hypothetical protein [Catellatospora bangladeshensis]GIF83093.1 hypothetical protein Cba03nite_44420 [Catellatospora bangladeshensis]